MRSSKKWDPSTTRGPRAAAARRRGFVTMPITKCAPSGGTRSLAAGGRGPRTASAS
jgi:hypothetical protein